MVVYVVDYLRCGRAIVLDDIPVAYSGGLNQGFAQYPQK